MLNMGKQIVPRHKIMTNIKFLTYKCIKLMKVRHIEAQRKCLCKSYIELLGHLRVYTDPHTWDHIEDPGNHIQK